eukprot:1141322-Pelagomonas_calceolata.AAC.2
MMTEKSEKKKTAEAVKSLSTSIKEKRIPRAEALHNLFARRRKNQWRSGAGVFTVFGLHEMDVPLSWKELARVTDLGSRQSGCGWR